MGLVLVFIIIGLLAGWWVTEDYRINQALAKAPRVAIAEVAEGSLARIVGTIAAGEHVQAPLSGRICVFYEVVVEEHRGKAWHVVIRECRGVPFAIDDGSGRALIDPAAARLAVEKDSTTRSGTFDDPTPIEAAFLARYNVSGQAWIGNKTLRYREGAFEIGETIAAAGLAVREPDPDGAARVTGYRDAPPTRLRMSSSPKLPLLLSDYPDAKR